MTPQEEQLLRSLVERINQTQLQEKDPGAEALLNQELGSNPDALYVMAQTVLVQNIALEQAKQQVAQLQQQVQQARQQPAHATSFLGNLLGHRAPVLAPPQPTYIPPPPPPLGYDPPYQQPQYQQPQYIPAGQPSFLRGAMQTAAGVAAGALAFEGVEAVLHGLGGFGHGGYGMGGFGMPGMMAGGFDRPEETVINNYYDQPGGLERGGQEHRLENSSDQGGAQFSDAGYQSDPGGYDTSNTDDTVLDGNLTQDEPIQDDGGSGFDDGGGGGFDGGGDFS